MARPYFPRRPMPAQSNRPRANLQIRASQLRVISEDGKQLGVMDLSSALKLSEAAGLDLVEISPNATPPIAKIVDYGKYMYQQEKSSKGKKPNSNQTETKAVRIGLKISEHDMQVKAGQADKFLEKNHPVKVEIALRGREKKFKDLAKDKLKLFLTYILVPNVAEELPKATPHGFSVMVHRDKKTNK